MLNFGNFEKTGLILQNKIIERLIYSSILFGIGYLTRENFKLTFAALRNNQMSGTILLSWMRGHNALSVARNESYAAKSPNSVG